MQDLSGASHSRTMGRVRIWQSNVGKNKKEQAESRHTWHRCKGKSCAQLLPKLSQPLTLSFKFRSHFQIF